MPRKIILFLATFALACGGGRRPANASSGNDPRALSESPPAPPTEAYDASGRAHACEPPSSHCPQIARDLKFSDACRRSGYRVQRCGCDELCSGKVEEKRHYDAAGHAKQCEPEQEGCTPTETSAAFQDACNERGYRLVLCGCEYLCTGDFQED